MTEAVSEFRAQVTFMGRAKEMLKNKLSRAGALVAVGGTSIVGYAHAAINFTPITELIDAVTGLIPSLMSLVIEMAPLIVTMAIISFLVTFFRKNILDMLNM
jgi:uncharacterized membrane protein